jgi:hypothetical protein
MGDKARRELIAKFDPFMADHLARYGNKEEVFYLTYLLRSLMSSFYYYQVN